MTGGIAIILGKIGRNFAAGMSGGIAYIYHNSKSIDKRNFNMESIEIEKLKDQDFDIVKNLVQNHYTHTQSLLAEKIITSWDFHKRLFVKIMPTEYKLALEKLANKNIEQIIN